MNDVFTENQRERCRSRLLRKRELRKKGGYFIILLSSIISIILFASAFSSQSGIWEKQSNSEYLSSYSREDLHSSDKGFANEYLPYACNVHRHELTFLDFEVFQVPEYDAWKVLLVNFENPTPTNHSMTLHYVEGDFLVDSRIVEPLQNMLSEMRSKGLSPLLTSAFRCYHSQSTLFENEIQKKINSGMTREQAKKETARIIAVPGTSEHQIGLAVDILSHNHQNLAEDFAFTCEGIWLANNSARFGFILRYPRFTEHITGIAFEPWHFRYVGVDVAVYITENKLTLEEFVNYRLSIY